MGTDPRRRHLTLLAPDRPDEAPPAQAAPPTQHPAGVWDLPAAPGYRRRVGVDEHGNLAVELNVSDRIPGPIRDELHWALERAMERALVALKV